VYAASKRATEDVVAVYSHQYGIRAIGTAGSALALCITTRHVALAIGLSAGIRPAD
jgi:hypothetical protein